LPEIAPRSLTLAAWAIGAGCFLGLAGLARAEQWVHWKAGLKRLSGHPRLAGFIEKVALGAGPLYSWSAAARVGGLSVCLWLVDGMYYWTAGQAVGFAPELSYGQAILVLGAAAATAFVPAVPGSFGTFETAVQACLMRLGSDGSSALAYAGFAHLVNYLAVTGLGIGCLYHAGYSLAHLKSLRPSADSREGPEPAVPS